MKVKMLKSALKRKYRRQNTRYLILWEYVVVLLHTRRVAGSILSQGKRWLAFFHLHRLHLAPNAVYAKTARLSDKTGKFSFCHFAEMSCNPSQKTNFDNKHVFVSVLQICYALQKKSVCLTNVLVHFMLQEISRRLPKVNNPFDGLGPHLCRVS